MTGYAQAYKPPQTLLKTGLGRLGCRWLGLALDITAV